MQTSIVLSQRFWFRAGDKDDCWVMTILQCQLAIAPWVRLPSVADVRKAAGDPDDGDTDGGNLTEVVRGATGTWPWLRGRLVTLRGGELAQLKALVREGRPVSVALLADELPPRLANGVDVPHQVTLAQRGDTLLMANPWAGAADRWEPCTWSEVQAAILEYGRARADSRGVWAVAWPTEVEALPFHPLADTLTRQPDPAELAAARRQGFAAAKAKASAAVAAITP